MNELFNFFRCTPPKMAHKEELTMSSLESISLSDQRISQIQTTALATPAAELASIHQSFASVSSVGSSNPSIGSVGLQISSSSSDSVAQATATLNAFALKKGKTPIKIEDLQQTVNFVSLHPIALGKEITYKKSGDLPYTVKITKEGTAVIHLKQEIGHGNFKVAKLACVIDQGQVKPAIKLTSHFIGDLSLRTVAKAEANGLSLFSEHTDSRIIKLFAEIDSTRKPKTSMYEELATEGELMDRIKAKDLTPEEKCQITKDIVQGLVEMELNGIMHRDIKPENIVLTRDETGNLRAKICDLGFAQGITSFWTAAGSTFYIAPELIATDRFSIPQTSVYYNKKIDAYAAGVTLYELLNNESQGEIFSSLPIWRQRANIIFHIQSNSQNPVDKLIAGLMNPNPCFRLSPALAFVQANRLTPKDFGAVA